MPPVPVADEFSPDDHRVLQNAQKHQNGVQEDGTGKEIEADPGNFGKGYIFCAKGQQGGAEKASGTGDGNANGQKAQSQGDQDQFLPASPVQYIEFEGERQVSKQRRGIYAIGGDPPQAELPQVYGDQQQHQGTEPKGFPLHFAAKGRNIHRDLRKRLVFIHYKPCGRGSQEGPPVSSRVLPPQCYDMAILQRDSEKVNLPRPVRKGLIFVKKFGIMKQKETVVFYII